MSEVKTDQVVKEEVDENVIESETRIDENGIKAFQAMGQKTLLSNNAVSIYKAFKINKDRLQPGRLTPEGYTFIKILSDMVDQKLNLE